MKKTKEEKEFDKSKRAIIRINSCFQRIKEAKQKKNYGKWHSSLMNLLLEVQPMMDNKDLSKLNKLMDEILKHKKLLLKEGDKPR